MAGRFIDKLKKAARLDPAKKDARSDDPNAFALQLLVRKAKDEKGVPLFTQGDVGDLKHSIRDADLQALMLAVLGGEDEEEALDMKSSDDGAE